MREEIERKGCCRWGWPRFVSMFVCQRSYYYPIRKV